MATVSKCIKNRSVALRELGGLYGTRLQHENGSGDRISALARLRSRLSYGQGNEECVGLAWCLEELSHRIFSYKYGIGEGGARMV